MPSRIVDITEQNIEDGVPGSCATCPAALALLREFPHTSKVSVDVSSADDPDDVRAFITVGTQWMTVVDNLEGLAQFIHDFDAGQPVQPLSFEVGW